MAAIIYVLFAISTGGAPPDMSALAQFESKPACEAAAQAVHDALAKGDNAKMLLCVSSDSLKQMARDSGMPGV